VVEGYPYADVPEVGMSFIAITDNDRPCRRRGTWHAPPGICAKR
jgi:hypothetical protein